MTAPRALLLCATAVMAMAAGPTPPPKAPIPASAPAPAPATAAPAASPAAPTDPAGAINAAAFDPAAKADALRDQLIKAEVLLDRAHFSPGVIDGRDGGNLQQALAAYQGAHGLKTGPLDAPTWNALAAADKAPAMTRYLITTDDVKGPFIGKTPTDMAEMAKLKHLGFDSPQQLLAERFHMDQALLAALNPGADFAKPGTAITVVATGAPSLGAQVASIEVDKSRQQVRAFDAAGKLVAVYPATVGSQERPAPSGDWAVRDVAPDPTYTFDPARLTFGKSKAKLTIAAGPNNPVGSTWIGLTKETYGIHGTPDPTLVGKRASHGCVRLTNWDAHQLGQAVKKGAKVAFVGEETRAKTAA
jgi:lipoprotein-anchoring transpeptidase ErfK/SrfK